MTTKMGVAIVLSIAAVALFCYGFLQLLAWGGWHG